MRNINNVNNSLIVSFIVGFHLFVFVILPIFLLPLSLFWALVLVPLAWVNTTHWGLIHEATHKLLHSESKTNEYMGRGPAIMLGASFHVLRFGHLMHHKLNRKWQSEFVKEQTVNSKFKYYATLMGGLYVTEILSTLVMAALPRKVFMALSRKGMLAGEPEVNIAGERYFYERGNIKAVRHDTMLIIAIYGIAFYLYGAMFAVLLAFIAIRSFMISFMDNIYHYDTPVDNSKAGKDLYLPKWLSALVLNSNYHETHHKNPQIAWRDLPNAHQGFDGSLFAHGIKQFRGPISA